MKVRAGMSAADLNESATLRLRGYERIRRYKRSGGYEGQGAYESGRLQVIGASTGNKVSAPLRSTEHISWASHRMQGSKIAYDTQDTQS
jgi:hypothetical protein